MSEQTISVPQKTLLVGHNGRMGRMLLQEASSHGLTAVGIDQPLDDAVLETVTSSVSLVIFCVPVLVLDEVLGRVCPYLPGDCIVSDITSVKEQPMRCMERRWPGRVVGTHPLFGPRHAEEESLPVVIVPGSRADEDAVRLTEGFFRALGFQVFRSTAGIHDHAMACVQNLNFITNLAYFALLAGKEEILPYLTPSFRRRMTAAKKMLTDDAEMFGQLFEANSHSHETVRQFTKLLTLAASGDTEMLTKKAQWWWNHEED